MIVKRNALRVVIGLLVLLELFALLFAVALLSNGAHGITLFSAAIAVLVPLVALFGAVRVYRRPS